MPMEIQQTLNDKAQARREGGQFLILSPQEGLAAALSALPSGLSSNDEVTNNSSPLQENGELFRFEEDAVSTAYTFTSAAEAIAQQLGVEIEIDESMPAKGSYNPHTQVAFASIPLAMLQPRMFSAQSCTKPSVTVAFRLYPANDSAKCANKSTT